ncbi:MAG TPA: antitoxin family protein [Pirellulaceae bacterium]|jgi:predicted DNA-binding antitoxin AbrB/MazE fold protein
MNQRIDAIFEKGIFRPEVPVHIAEGQRVSLNVESPSAALDDIRDVKDLLDAEFMDSCRQSTGDVPSLAQTRKLLSALQGSLAERVSQERDEQ